MTTPNPEAPEGGKAQSTDRYSWTQTGMKRDPAGSWVVAGVAGVAGISECDSNGTVQCQELPDSHRCAGCPSRAPDKIVKASCLGCADAICDECSTSGVTGTSNEQRQVREDSQGLGEPGRLSPSAPGHSWHDYGQQNGRNRSWCSRCKLVVWTGEEPDSPCVTMPTVGVALPAACPECGVAETRFHRPSCSLPRAKAVLTDEQWRAAEESSNPFLRCGCGATMPCTEHYTRGVDVPEGGEKG